MARLIVFGVLVAVFLADLLLGRPILNGLDSLIPRKPIPREKPYTVEISIPGMAPLRRDIWCEKYYDAEGGSRGNFWAVRERGVIGYLDSSKVQASVKGVGTVTFIMPTCSELEQGGGGDVSQMLLLVNGAVYGHKKSEGNLHTFIPRNANEGKDVTLEFTVSVGMLGR